VGLAKVPHEPMGAQVKVTPALVVSLVRETLTAKVADSARDAGIVDVKLMVMGGPVIVTVFWAFLAASVTEVAMIATEPPEGTAAGEL
jgi:hypothetical protein